MTTGDRTRRARRWAAGGVLLGALGLAAVWLAVHPAGPRRGGPEGTGEPGGAAATAGQLTVRVQGPEGEAVAGARIVLDRAREGPVARTDGAGEARFEDLPSGRWVLLVEAPGRARARRTLDVPAGALTETVVLTPGSILTGRVLSERGDAIDGATIRVTLADCDPHLDAARCPPAWVARSGADGRFALDTLEPGAHDVELAAEGFTAEVRRVELGRGAPTELQVALHLAAALRGRVRTGRGDPAIAVEVVLAGSGVWPPRAQTTDDEGRFAWEGIPSGVYEVRARDAGRVAPPAEGITVEPGQTVEIALVLTEGEVVAGKVVADATGEPIAGAELLLTEELLGLSPRAARTGDQGAFRFEGLLPRSHYLTVRAEGYVAQVATPCEPGADPLEVRLVRASTLRGVVYDARDRPVAGARLEVLGEGALAAGLGGAFSEELFSAQLGGPSRIAPSGELGVTLGTVPPLPTAGDVEGTPVPTGGLVPGPEAWVTDAQGRFEVRGLPAGTIEIVAQHPDHAPGSSTPVRVAAGATVDDVQIVLPDGGTIQGRVVDGRGFPVPSVLVELAAEREPLPRTVLAGDDGAFEFLGAIGVVTLTAYPSGQPTARERVEVPSGETMEVRLTIETELHTLRGRTVDRRSFPVPGASLALRSLRAESPTRRAAISADDGTFEIAGLPAPPYRLEVDHPDYTTEQVRRIERSDREVVVTLVPGGTLRGAVQDAFRDLPAVGAQVVLESGGERVASTTTQNDGSFELQRIRVGRYELIATMPGMLEARATAELREPPSGPIALDVGTLELLPGGGIEGEVVDALGEPVAGAEVVAGPEADWTGAARTDPSGRFALMGLPPGDHAVVARHRDLGITEEPMMVRVHALEATEGIRLRLPGRTALEPTEEPEAAYQTGVAVAVARARGGVTITAVVAGSRAAAAGLREGDRVLSVDGTAVESPAQARSLLRGPAGVDAVLELLRGGQERRLHVPRERFRPPSPP